MSRRSSVSVTGGARRSGLVAGLAAFLFLVAVPPPPGVPAAGWSVASVALLMAIWWMTEAVPLAATALVPLVLLPLLGAGTLETIAPSYAHPLIFLFLGGFLIAKSLERWGLHRRVAAVILRRGATSPTGLIASMMAATAFLSMWISNTATAMVMAPIAQSVIHSTRHVAAAAGPNGGFAPALLLGIAFSATIGGMATLIGTPPNALLAGYLQSAHGTSIGFGQWMLLGVPVAAVLLPVAWLVLTRLAFRVDRATDGAVAGAVDALGNDRARLATGAKLTAVIVAAAGLALIFRPLLERLVPALPLSDAGIVMTAAVMLFATPAGRGQGMLLEWRDARTIRWDVLILFGGGLALAEAIDGSGLSRALGGVFASLDVLPLALVVLLAMVGIVYLGELASNTAMAAVFLPVAGAAALGLGRAPLDLVLPVGLAASLGFMLPVATPPNAIVYGTGDVSSGQMLKAGAILDVAGILIVYAFAMTLGAWVFRA